MRGLVDIPRMAGVTCDRMRCSSFVGKAQVMEQKAA
jgi:hypothetical protein